MKEAVKKLLRTETIINLFTNSILNVLCAFLINMKKVAVATDFFSVAIDMFHLPLYCNSSSITEPPSTISVNYYIIVLFLFQWQYFAVWQLHSAKSQGFSRSKFCTAVNKEKASEGFSVWTCNNTV